MLLLQMSMKRAVVKPSDQPGGWAKNKGEIMLRDFVSGMRFKNAVGVLTVVAVWSLACGGGSDAPVNVPAPMDQPPAAASPSSSGVQLDGTWQIRPVDQELRRMRVIDAAFKGNKAREKLGQMTGEEQSLYREWRQKKGAEADQMKSQLKFMKNCEFEFQGSQITVRFDAETHGPVPYTLVSSSNQQTVISFDPGLGNGAETHRIDWSSKDKGTNNITGVDGSSFIPLVIKRLN